MNGVLEYTEMGSEYCSVGRHHCSTPFPRRSMPLKQLYGPCRLVGITAGEARLKLLKGNHASTSRTFRNAKAVDQGGYNRHRYLRQVRRRTFCNRLRSYYW